MKAVVAPLAIALLSLNSTHAASATADQPEVLEQADMVLWFNQPAEGRSDSLALGNGRLGAVLHHGVTTELIQVSEETRPKVKRLPPE